MVDPIFLIARVSPELGLFIAQEVGGGRGVLTKHLDLWWYTFSFIYFLPLKDFCWWVWNFPPKLGSPRSSWRRGMDGSTIGWMDGCYWRRGMDGSTIGWVDGCYDKTNWCVEHKKQKKWIEKGAIVKLSSTSLVVSRLKSLELNWMSSIQFSPQFLSFKN